MSESEDCDDLPPITVNVSNRDASTFSMPSADVLASQRAREADTERELSQLRLAHSDSSGSEGDALAALRAVDADDAMDEDTGRSTVDPSVEHLLAAVGLEQLDPLAAVDDVSDLLTRPNTTWDERDMVASTAVLVAALLTTHPRGSRRVLRHARALHALLEDCDSAHILALSSILNEALSRAATLRLVDWLRAGGDVSRTLAETLARAALVDLTKADAKMDEEELVTAAGVAWRRIDDAGRLELLQLAPRAVTPTPGLLQALAPPAKHANSTHRLHRLKVEVAAAKLRLLFRSTSGS